MSIVTQKSITAENQWSDVVQLQGDDAVMGERSALISLTRDDSTVSARRYASASDAVENYLASVDLDSTMTDFGVPVTGFYRFGVATGNYGGTALTITVEQ